MIIKSLKLENIRSYLNEKIDFPQGSVLLSGDIGSGKSTILLAIEFALFGLKRGELAPNALLRNGKNQGSVELCIDVENKEYTIKRVLKRGKDDIKQSAGYIITQGVKKDATPVELKSNILEILGYPKELLTKKDLIYRYTVYTPQESMKYIISGNKEERLETLRKVFGVDKYKKIRENSSIITKDLKNKSKEYQGIIFDLDEKKVLKKNKQDEIKTIEINIRSVEPEIKIINEEIEKQKTSMKTIEEDIVKLNQLKREFEVANNDLMNRVSENNMISKETLELEQNIRNLEREVAVKHEDIDLNQEIADKNIKIEEIEKKISELRRLISEYDTKIKSCHEIIKKVLTLDNCPMCEQKVEHSHKESIRTREDSKIKEFESNIKKIILEEKEEIEKITRRKKELELLRQKEKEIAVIRFKLENLKEKKLLFAKKKQRSEEIKKEIGHINVKKMDLSRNINNISEVEEKYKHIRKMIDEYNEQLKNKEIKKAEFEKEKQGILNIINIVSKEIEEKEKTFQKLKRINEILHWLDNYFIKLMAVMEKNVMASIHQEFNSVFQNWFSTIIEDDIISVRLDDEFTPVIEQNGYETSIENLSGGEKTSVALSYRISLNRVINNMISTIKTKDLLILDEPTDGFSTDQLDKVRDVLDQLDNKQIIIVSHENKIESFVENIMRISKQEHISSIISP